MTMDRARPFRAPLLNEIVRVRFFDDDGVVENVTAWTHRQILSDHSEINRGDDYMLGPVRAGVERTVWTLRSDQGVSSRTRPYLQIVDEHGTTFIGERVVESDDGRYVQVYATRYVEPMQLPKE